MTTSEPTHRVVGGTHRRSSNDGGPALKYEPGDTITPNERELERFPSRFEPIAEDADETDENSTDENSTDENGERDATSDATDEPTEAPDDDEDDDSADEGDESEDVGPAPDPLTEQWVEAAGYHALKSAGARFDDINGNWGEDRLRAELLEKVE